MRVIVCNLQMFSNDQMIQVIDTEGGHIFYQKVDIESLPEAVCALAKEYGIENVKLYGGRFAEALVESIKEFNELTYSSNNIEIEVIENV